MPKKQRQDLFIPFLTVLADAAALEASFLFSYWLRFLPSFARIVPIQYGVPPLEEYIKSSLFVIPIWLLLFQSRGLYKPRRAASFSDEFFAVVRIIFIGMLIVMAAAFLYRSFSYSRVVFGIIGVAAVLFVSTGRFALMKFEHWWYSKGNDLKRVIIVGTSATAQQVIQSLASNHSLGYEVLGYCSTGGKIKKMIPRVPHLGSISSLPDLIKLRNVDAVLIALDKEEHTSLHKLINSCQGLDIEMMMVPDILELMTSLVKIRHIEGIPFLGIKNPALSTWNAIMKRAFDLVLASLILAAASPLLLIIAVLIKLDSRGPVLYFQERIGLDGEVFRVIKFRSMQINAEQSTGPVWSKKNDPRATRAGRFLRRFSLDELPQLLNVLKGDMSIVGPRPERQHFVEQFKKEIPRYSERHRVRTGMTGWAQVNGLRGNASIIERTKYDIYYIENWSLTFDVKIILKTIHAVLFGKDAY
ncbi:MAG: undecaprenyl-phosphate glucose phosphotransferase [Bacteroidetes bacterium]|nr:undecaprenyl-phosphate glucose phosphotransferase [Bacteroidota bacterium]